MLWCRLLQVTEMAIEIMVYSASLVIPVAEMTAMYWCMVVKITVLIITG